MNVEEVIENQPIVIDNGTGVLKAGFAGEDAPKCVFPSMVGRPKHLKIMVQTSSAMDGDSFVGNDAAQHRGVMRLNYPMEHGVVEDWGDMEKIWSHVYSKSCLNTSSEMHPVRLCVSCVCECGCCCAAVGCGGLCLA
jgi:centractin